MDLENDYLIDNWAFSFGAVKNGKYWVAIKLDGDDDFPFFNLKEEAQIVKFENNQLIMQIADYRLTIDHFYPHDYKFMMTCDGAAIMTRKNGKLLAIPIKLSGTHGDYEHGDRFLNCH